MKRHDSCKTCGFLRFGYMIGDVKVYSYYCEINKQDIEYPRKMGGMSKCPCYMDKAEYKKESKKKIIDNHVYPQKTEIKKEVEE